MSKRSITQQQHLRIQQNQTLDSTHDGLVITRFGKQAEILRSDETHLLCMLRPHLSDVAAGDRVAWLQSDESRGVITHVYPRSTELSRITTRGVKKTIAANMTQLMVVVAPQPELTWTLLDSYLVMAELLGLTACIIYNKIDLTPWTHFTELQTIYSPLYPIISTSKKQCVGKESLLQACNQQTTIFVGQSGVGKSSLIKQLIPHQQQIQTGELSSRAHGRHTTSSTTWYPIPSGGALIDSPGVREFNLSHLGAQPIIEGFPEFKPYLGQCKFRNCEHITSPDCAIIQAINNHLIAPSRHKSYARMIK